MGLPMSPVPWSLGTSMVCSTVRSEPGSCGITQITSATCSNTICGTKMCLYHWKPAVASELSGWLVLGVASQLLRLRSRRCAALSGPRGHDSAQQRACHPTTIFCSSESHALSRDVTAWTAPTESQQSSVSLHHGFVSMSGACGISTVLALSSIRITPVGLARSCQAGTSTSLFCVLPQWNPESFEPLGSASSSGQGFRRSCRLTGMSQLLFKNCICWVSKVFC